MKTIHLLFSQYFQQTKIGKTKKSGLIILMAMIPIFCGLSTGYSMNIDVNTENQEEEPEEKVDDWVFKPSKSPDFYTHSNPGVLRMTSALRLETKNIGFSTGGAKDINNFYENIENGFLPLPSDITYEGLFYGYFFDTGLDQPCNQLFCPSYTSSVSKDPFSGNEEYFLSVGLNSGISQSDFSRKRLNIVIVLDISGSMSSPFDRYYYDQRNVFIGPHPFPPVPPVGPTLPEKEWNKTKMQVASESIVALMDHLRPEDSLSVVLFDHNSHLAKPFRTVKTTDMKAIKGHILELQPRGGTNMSAGMQIAGKIFNEYSSMNDKDVENRIIFLTDAQPNHGELSEGGMADMARNNAKQKIYTTFIGVGVDFNTELIESISKIRGANYYSVHSPGEFKKQMDKNFDYMVTPLVFDLQLKVESSGFEIQKIYGSPEANEATNEVIKVKTLFPSNNEGEETRGGLVLLQMKKRPDSDSLLHLSVSYEDRNGKKESHFAEFSFADQAPRGEYYDNMGIRKGIVLSRYATLLKNWALYEGSHLYHFQPEIPLPSVEIYQTQGIPPFPGKRLPLSRWERQSKELVVSEGYKELFNQFTSYFKEEMEAIGDPSMRKEMEILDLLSNRP